MSVSAACKARGADGRPLPAPRPRLRALVPQLQRRLHRLPPLGRRLLVVAQLALQVLRQPKGVGVGRGERALCNAKKSCTASRPGARSTEKKACIRSKRTPGMLHHQDSSRAARPGRLALPPCRTCTARRSFSTARSALSSRKRSAAASSLRPLAGLHHGSRLRAVGKRGLLHAELCRPTALAPRRRHACTAQWRRRTHLPAAPASPPPPPARSSACSSSMYSSSREVSALAMAASCMAARRAAGRQGRAGRRAWVLWALGWPC